MDLVLILRATATLVLFPSHDAFHPPLGQNHLRMKMVARQGGDAKYLDPDFLLKSTWLLGQSHLPLSALVSRAIKRERDPMDLRGL